MRRRRTPPLLTGAELAFLRRVSADGAALVGEDAALAQDLARAGMIRTLQADADAYAVLSGAGIRSLRWRPGLPPLFRTT